MRIPRVVHQVWKNADIPKRWRGAVASVKLHHPGWRYELWTDERALRHIEERHPVLAPIYRALSRDIMRADVLRYVLMHDFGGLYCDLDYEFLRPYPYGEAELLLSLERDMNCGDPQNEISNYMFASEPGHALWRDILDEVISNPPAVGNYSEIPEATGPGLVTRVFLRNEARYRPCTLTPRPIFSPHRVHSIHERAILLNGGVTYGFHRGSGSWKERWSRTYLTRKIGKLFRAAG